jgi:hypothetical protein
VKGKLSMKVKTIASTLRMEIETTAHTATA